MLLVFMGLLTHGYLVGSNRQVISYLTVTVFYIINKLGGAAQPAPEGRRGSWQDLTAFICFERKVNYDIRPDYETA